MKITITFFFLFFLTSNVFSQEYKKTKQREKEEYATTVAAERARNKTKVLFDNALYNYEAIHGFYGYDSLYSFELIKDSSEVSKLIHVTNKNKLQIIKINPKKGLSDSMQKIKSLLSSHLYLKITKD